MSSQTPTACLRSFEGVVDPHVAPRQLSRPREPRGRRWCTQTSNKTPRRFGNPDWVTTRVWEEYPADPTRRRDDTTSLDPNVNKSIHQSSYRTVNNGHTGTRSANRRDSDFVSIFMNGRKVYPNNVLSLLSCTFTNHSSQRLGDTSRS